MPRIVQGSTGPSWPVTPRIKRRSTFWTPPPVSEYSEGVEAGGGQIAMPKMAVLGVGYVAYCRDLAGNGFGIFQGDEGAA